MRLFDPNPSALQALIGSQIHVSLGVRNQDISSIALSQDAAKSWLATNLEPYLNDIVFSYITVGNEAIPGDYASYIASAMQNLQNILNAGNLASTTKARDNLIKILGFLSAQGSPLMVNVYPYFAYAAEPANVHSDYAQFTAKGPVVLDGNLRYQNMFDAIVDACYWAMEREGVTDVGVVVSETDWPSAGNGNFTTPELAATYDRNLMEHAAKNGTPKRPLARIEGYIFPMFNENHKPDGVEQHWGLFHPTMEPVYPLFAPV